MLMTLEDEIDRLKNLVEQAHAELSKLKSTTYQIVEERRRYLDLLEMVRDAGMPHSHKCDCDRCHAYYHIVKELAR
jgi:hypothetical protein